MSLRLSLLLALTPICRSASGFNWRRRPRYSAQEREWSVQVARAPSLGIGYHHGMKHSAHRLAFTLIELLVVVSIIAVVASLMLPAISTAKKMANAAACQSNLRQIALGCVGYQSDNEGLYPRYNVDTQARPQYGDIDIWFMELAPYVGREATTQAGRIDMVAGEVKSVIKGCPSFRADRNTTWTWRPGYAMNASLGLPERSVSSHFTVNGTATDFSDASITHSASRILFGCGYYAKLTPNPGVKGKFISILSSYPELRHSGRANYSFCDGHVQSLEPSRAWFGMQDPSRL